MKNEEDTDAYRKKLEEAFSDFYNGKKNVVVSVGFDDKFILQPMNINLVTAEVKAKPPVEINANRILLLPVVF